MIFNDLPISRNYIKYEYNFMQGNYLSVSNSKMGSYADHVSYEQCIGSGKSIDILLEASVSDVKPKYISKPFYKAFDENFDKINRLFKWGDVVEKAAECFIIDHDGDKHIFHIKIDSSYVYVMTFLEKIFICYMQIERKTNVTSFFCHHLFKDKIETFLSEIYTDTVYLLWFLTHCKTEVKHLAPGKKLKDVNCKYLNKTGTAIQIIDSRWFTTLVKSEEFKVRGHFRLQPYGHGLKKKKIIWISEYSKNGYTMKNFKDQ